MEVKKFNMENAHIALMLIGLVAITSGCLNGGEDTQAQNGEFEGEPTEPPEDEFEEQPPTEDPNQGDEFEEGEELDPIE